MPCVVCQIPMTATGPHLPAQLPCGHYKFGKSCLEESVRRYNKCPVCNVPARVDQVVALFGDIRDEVVRIEQSSQNDSSANNSSGGNSVSCNSIPPVTDFRVKVVTLSGKKISMVLPNRQLTTVSQLKSLLFECEGVPHDSYRLIYTGQTMDDRDLAHYNVQHEDTIHLVHRLKGGVLVGLTAKGQALVWCYLAASILAVAIPYLILDRDDFYKRSWRLLALTAFAMFIAGLCDAARFFPTFERGTADAKNILIYGPTCSCYWVLAIAYFCAALSPESYYDIVENAPGMFDLSIASLALVHALIKMGGDVTPGGYPQDPLSFKNQLAEYQDLLKEIKKDLNNWRGGWEGLVSAKLRNKADRMMEGSDYTIERTDKRNQPRGAGRATTRGADPWPIVFVMFAMVIPIVTCPFWLPKIPVAKAEPAVLFDPNILIYPVLHKHSDKLYSGLQEGVRPTIVDSTAAGSFLGELNKAWTDHSATMVMIRDMYMDGVYVQQAQVEPVYTLELRLFRAEVVEHSANKDHFKCTLLGLIEQERKGEVIEWMGVRNACPMLIALEGDSNRAYYESQFESLFLRDSAQFYCHASRKLLEENSASVHKESDQPGSSSQQVARRREVHKILQVSAHQMCVLMRFNQHSQTTFEKTATDIEEIPEQDLKRALQELAMGKKQRVLVRRGAGKEIEPHNGWVTDQQRKETRAKEVVIESISQSNRNEQQELEEEEDDKMALAAKVIMVNGVDGDEKNTSE